MLLNMRSQNWVLKSVWVLFMLSMASCSSTPSSEENAKSVIDYDANTDYRKTEKSLSVSLETPPNLLLPAQKKDSFEGALKKTEKSVAEQHYEYIPTYRADHLQMKSNLNERWLEIEGISSEQVWEGIQAFFVSLGMPVKETRKDIGVIRTEFTPRKELVPLDDQGPLTRLLNSWRPELAEGAYDRLIARVESGKKQVTRVYFYHYMVFDLSLAESDPAAMTVGENWQIKPFNPAIEAEALYQAMIFFGSSQADALKNLEMVENQIELADDESEFDGFKIKANSAKTWAYFKGMLYRADWHLETLKNAEKKVWVQVPESARKESSFVSKLAFWKSTDSKKYLPKQVEFTVTEITGSNTSYSLLRVQSAGGAEPLTAEKKKYIFQLLGLFAK